MPPVSLRASTAEKVSVSTQRWASTRAVLIGLPASAEIVSASSSTRSPTSSAARSRVAARSCWGKSADSKASRAACAARSTVRRVALGDPADRAAVVGALDLGPLAGLEPLAGGEKLVVGRLDCLRRHTGGPPSWFLFPSLDSSTQPRAGRDSGTPNLSRIHAAPAHNRAFRVARPERLPAARPGRPGERLLGGHAATATATGSG